MGKTRVFQGGRGEPQGSQSLQSAGHDALAALSSVPIFAAWIAFALSAGGLPAHAAVPGAKSGDFPADFGTQGWGQKSFSERLLAVTNLWLGRPYVLGGLGEGADGRYDRDPLYRFDTFDCTTFVETAMSAAMSHSEDEFLPTILGIRYDHSQVDFVSRNHFTEIDWIPNTIRDGFFEDITSPLATRFVLAEAVATIDKRGWYRKLGLGDIQGPGFDATSRAALLPQLHAEGDPFEPVVNHLPYIPFTTFLAVGSNTLTSGSTTRLDPTLIAALPDVAVVNFVRPGWNLVAQAGTQLNISHQGLFIKHDGEAYLRHASSDSRHRVVEDRLIDYIQRNLSSPTLKGLFLLGVVKH